MNSAGRLRDANSVLVDFQNWRLRILQELGAGDEARTRNFQLGKLNFRSFIFNTYKIAPEKCTCMRCMPCMHCLICVSLRDVWGTVCLRSTFDPQPVAASARSARFQAAKLLSGDRIASFHGSSRNPENAHADGT